MQMQTCFGPIAEWHLDFQNAFSHEEFHLGARLHQPAEVIAAVFLDALEGRTHAAHILLTD